MRHIFRYDDILEYHINKDSISFKCSSVEDNNSAATVMKNFLFDMSKGHTVFFYGYRLPNEDVSKIIDPSMILDKAEILLDPYKTFFHLREARIEVEHSDYACETTVYFFENEVRWTDFLAASVITDFTKLMKEGKLSAYFMTFDQGADYCFECSKLYEKRLLRFFQSMADAEYVVRCIKTFPIRRTIESSSL